MCRDDKLSDIGIGCKRRWHDRADQWLDGYFYPGYRFKILDSLITNFHLPESTLLMLVSALAGREHVLAAYQEAIENKYRFFSFGDAMFITSEKTREGES